MLGWWRRLDFKRRAFVLALSLHIVVIVLLSVSYDTQRTVAPQVSKAQPEVMKAVAVDEAKLQAEMDKLKQEERRKQQAEAARQKRLEQKAQEAKQAREREERRLAELKKQKEAEAREAKRKAAEAAKLKKEREAEAARLAKLKKEKEALEKKRKQEAERKKVEEDKRRAEEEAKRKAAEEALRTRMAEEQQRLDAEKQRQNASIVNHYVGLIRQKVERNWIKPLGTQAGMSCVVRVRLSTSGTVLLAQVVEGSGNAVFDRSVETAVQKASPLPLPEDTSVIEDFPELQFRFAPKQ